MVPILLDNTISLDDKKKELSQFMSVGPMASSIHDGFSERPCFTVGGRGLSSCREDVTKVLGDPSSDKRVPDTFYRVNIDRPRMPF
jgi:hypothetical protein